MCFQSVCLQSVRNFYTSPQLCKFVCHHVYSGRVFSGYIDVNQIGLKVLMGFLICLIWHIEHHIELSIKAVFFDNNPMPIKWEGKMKMLYIIIFCALGKNTLNQKKCTSLNRKRWIGWMVLDLSMSRNYFNQVQVIWKPVYYSMSSWRMFFS